LRGGKGGIFVVGPGRHLTSLRHCVRFTASKKELYKCLWKCNFQRRFNFAHEMHIKRHLPNSCYDEILGNP